MHYKTETCNLLFYAFILSYMVYLLCCVNVVAVINIISTHRNHSLRGVCLQIDTTYLLTYFLMHEQ